MMKVVSDAPFSLPCGASYLFVVSVIFTPTNTRDVQTHQLAGWLVTSPTTPVPSPPSIHSRVGGGVGRRMLEILTVHLSATWKMRLAEVVLIYYLIIVMMYPWYSNISIWS